nr:transposase [Ruegeria atlantica]
MQSCASIGDGHQFRNGREFAAWLGLTPANGAGTIARIADRNLVCGTHQGQRSKPRKQAGHITASDKCTNQIKKDLLRRSHSHIPFAVVAKASLVEFSLRGRKWHRDLSFLDLLHSLLDF